MLGRTLSMFANVPLSVVGMLIFVASFLVALAWILGARPPQFYSNLAQMPLREDGEKSNE